MVPKSVSEVMSSITSKTTAQEAPAPVQPEIRIVKEAPAAEVAPVPVAAVPESSAPETPVAEPPAEAGAETSGTEPEAPAVDLSGEVTIDDMVLRAQRNADGTFKSKIDPSEKFDFEMVADKQTGEKRAYSKTIPELMRMARDGVALQQIMPKYKQYEERFPALLDTANSLQQRLDAQMALNREILADEQAYATRRAEYAQEMSPEKRLARMEAERDEQIVSRQQSERQARQAQAANAFIESRISGAIGKAEGVVGVEATAGKVMLLTNDLMVNGVIPPANWPEMERRINAPDGPFQSWLAGETSKRSQSDAAQKEAQRKLDEDRRRAQQVVNDAGRSIAPVGRAAADTPPARPRPANTRGAIDQIIHGRPVPGSPQHAVGTG